MESIKIKRIAVFGGSFNPPHVGHVSVLRTVAGSGLADEIWVMPSGERRDKTIGVSGADRLEMVRRMVADISSELQLPLIISDFELCRGGLTATYETKKLLEDEYPDTEFYFVIGSDAANGMLEKWVNGEALYNEGRFIIVTCDDEDSFELPPRGIVLKNLGAKKVVEVSSTMIRAAVLDKKEIDIYTTPGVAKYILDKNLYIP